MKNIEDISELISKHKLGTATELEESVLSEWLEKTPNRFQFDNTSSGKTFESKIDFYQRKDTYAKWLELNASINKKKRRRVWSLIAAILILPISIGVLLLNIKDVDKDSLTSPIAKLDEIVLTTSNGLIHQLEHIDTTLQLGAIQVEVKDGEISYSSPEKQGVLEYNMLNVPVGKTFKLVLPDKSVVWLNSNTKLKYPTAFTGDQRNIYLAQGEIFLDVAKDKSKPFVVDIDGEQVEVLGTKFNIKHYEEDGAKIITLLEGSVAIETNVLQDGEQTLVKLFPNQQAVINESINKVEVSAVDASLYTAWIDHVFRYEEERLEVILNDLSRHYGLKVFYQNSSCKAIEYSLRLNKEKSIEEILNVLELLGGIRFEQNKNVVTVKQKM
jgi:hypothetical protein